MLRCSGYKVAKRNALSVSSNIRGDRRPPRRRDDGMRRQPDALARADSARGRVEPVVPHHDGRAARYAFPALLLANLFLAAGPWMVRLADVGPVAAAFWRLALALPFLAFVAIRQGRGRPFPGWAMIGACALGGLFFAADLAAWHEGILRTRLANASLFGNFASFLFAIYGFILLRRLPRPGSGPGAAACRGRNDPAARAAASSFRPTISPATCSPCPPACSTPSI